MVVGLRVMLMVLVVVVMMSMGMVMMVMMTFARALFEKLTGVCSSLGWQKPTSGFRSWRLHKVLYYPNVELLVWIPD